MIAPEGARYDLVLEVGDRLIRVQCKYATRRGDVIRGRLCTSRHTPNGYVRTTYSAAEIDGFALYCPETRDSFWLPIAEFAGQGYVHLRLVAARNNQLALCRMASDYAFGAIAQLGERVTGSHEVGGSNPPSSISTSTPLARAAFRVSAAYSPTARRGASPHSCSSR